MWKTWRVLLLGIMIATASYADQLLETLKGAEGKNKMVLCVKSGGGFRRCPGVLLQRHWVLARANCVARGVPQRMGALRVALGGNCEDIEAGYNVYGGRRSRASFLHPWFDLALVMLDAPYSYKDRLANVTTARTMLAPNGVLRWMGQYFNKYKYPNKQVRVVSNNGMNPLLLLGVTMLMPMSLFLVFYVYIIVYTGHGGDYRNMTMKIH